MNVLFVLILSFGAAFLGTIVMTVGQEIEIRIKKRPISYTPAIAVFQILRLDFEKLSSRMKGVASYVVHFGYGTVWGFPLALFYLFSFMSFWPVLIVYYLVILVQGWVSVPLLGIAGPPWSWGWRAVLTEMLHKAVYSLATVLIFFALV